MFVNGVEVIGQRLENINLNIQRNMQPKSERPPVCPKLPLLHLTPSSSTQKKGEVAANGNCNPSLLRPQHEIPPTPPPQIRAQALDFFPERIG